MPRRPRVMFVDDDREILHGLENAMFDLEDDADLVFTDSGQAAIEHLEHETIDVLVSDMRMPGISGHALLRRAQEVSPTSYRIVLSGTTEFELAGDALTLAHDFVSKPCTDETLMDVVQRGIKLATAELGDLAQRLGSISSLPPRPKVYNQLSAYIARDASLDEIAGLLQEDVGLTAKLLHIANTAFFAGTHRVRTVHDAVRRLGVSCVRGLVLSTEVFASAPHWALDEVETINRHSLEVAARAHHIASPDFATTATVAGLVHDLGSLLLCTDFYETYKTLTLTDPREQERDVEEETVFGWNHADVGAHLLRLWNMGEDISLIVAHHHRPHRAPERYRRMAWTLYLADRFNPRPPPAPPNEVADLVERWKELTS